MDIREKTLKELSSLIDKLERAETVQSRIQLLVDCVGNPNLFAKRVGMSVSGLKRYLNGGEPTASKIIQIAESTGINPAWLLTGKGFIFSNDSGFVSNERGLALLTQRDDFLDALDSTAKEKSKKRIDAYNNLKLALSSYSEETQEIIATSVALNSKEFNLEAIEFATKDLKSSFLEEFALIPGYRIQVSAGHGTNPLGGEEEPCRHLAFRRKWLKWRGFSEKDLAIVWAKGDSMEPTINNNDTLVVHLGRTVPQDGHLYIFRNEEQLFVKRYQGALGSWRLISDNKVYDTLDIKKEEQHQFEVIGQVVHIAKDLGN
ncbi:MAG: XRE family transcriptional regulator [Vibrio sp.]|uniref:XRE family transcriptional regulator n=1 Tax=Vibrio sp. TaxID=678 RepID=UPI003A8B449D